MAKVINGLNPDTVKKVCTRKLNEAKDVNNSLAHNGAMSGFIDIDSIEMIIDLIKASNYTFLPEKWRDELEKCVLENDPEYTEYLRLKAKFDK